jgi:hypothetical protein
MKKILCMLLFTSIFSLSLSSQVKEAVFRPSGMMSSATENVNKEADPVFAGMTKIPDAMKKMGQGILESVSGIASGMAIVTRTIENMIKLEYGFSLLSSHKYMVNDCLGIKASSGQFKLKFANPEIKVNADGKISIKLEIDKIKFSALKVRIKPRSPDFSDPNPCHFSGKFEVGGEATNVSVKLTLDLVTTAMSGATTGYCFFAFDDPVDIKWTIGGFNLRPFPNALDNVAREMVEDALNNGMTDLIYNRFIQASRAVIPEFYEACQSAYGNSKDLGDKISNNAESETEKWSTKTASGLAKKTGRLSLVFPKDVEWSVDIYSAANKFITNRSSANKHGSYSLAPGKYNIRLNTVRVDNFPIIEGMDSRIKAGILNVTIAGHWELRTENDKFLTSGNRPKKLALPVGRYLFKEGKNSRNIEITDQQEQLIAEEEEAAEKWTVSPGVDDPTMGAFVFDFPSDVEWTVAVYQLPERKYLRIVGKDEKLETVPLDAGKFEFVLNNVPVKDVPIEVGNRTALKYGILQVNGNSSWTIWDASGKTHFKTENGGTRMVFPVGTYIIKMGGANVKIVLKPGETIEL